MKKTVGMQKFQFVPAFLRQDSTRRIKLLVVIGVLLFAYFVTPYLTVEALIVVSVGFGALLAIMYLSKNQQSLFVIFLAATLLFPIDVSTGTNTTINITILLIPAILGLWIFDHLVEKTPFDFIHARPFLPLILFGISSTLSFGVGQLPWFLFAEHAPILSQLAGLGMILLSVALFIVLPHIVRDLQWLRNLTWVFIAIGMVYIFGRVLQFYGRGIVRLFPIGVTGSVFWVILVVLPLSQAFFNEDLKPKWKAAFLVLVAATFYVALTLSSGWKSGWVPPAVAAGLLVALRFPRFSAFAGLVAALGVLLSGAVIELVRADAYSFVTRIAAWDIILSEIARVSLLFGLGPANYYFYTPLFPILGWSVEFNSHNNFVDLIAQVGVMGLALFVWFIIELTLLSFQLFRKQLDHFSKAYTAGVIAATGGILMSMALGDWFLPFVYNVGLRGFRASILGWLFLSGIVVIQTVHRRQQENSGLVLQAETVTKDNPR